MIIVDQREKKTMINNEYIIKHYIIHMCVHTYRLNRWDMV